MQTNDQNDYETDVLVVGSGMVGLALTLTLSSAGLRVIVLDKIESKRQVADAFDGRASAIAASSKKMLEQMGLWSSLEDEATPIRDIRVIDQGSSMFLHFDARDISAEALGFMVENRHFRKACFDKIVDEKNIQYLAPMKLISYQRDIGNIKAKTECGSQIKASLIVGADGRDSVVRQLSGISVNSTSYKQTAIVLNVKHDLPHYNVAYEHFLSAGPFAILPLGGKRGDNKVSSIVWTERTDRAKRFLSLSDHDFKHHFEERFGDFLGGISFFGPRWSYPLSSQYAERYVSSRMALIGDAAHLIHPIAGQGLNLGLRDVAALSEILADAARLGLDIGDIGILDQYQKWRRFDNTTMLILTDGFNRLFSNNVRAIKVARDVGLVALNRTKFFKHFTIKHAMGSLGTLPKLLRGESI